MYKKPQEQYFGVFLCNGSYMLDKKQRLGIGVIGTETTFMSFNLDKFKVNKIDRKEAIIENFGITEIAVKK